MAVSKLPFFAFAFLVVLSSSALAATNTTAAATTTATAPATTTGNATTTATAPAGTTTSAAAPTCATITNAASASGVTTFVVTGTSLDQCTQANFTFVNPPATTTSLATTTAATTTSVASTTAVTTATNATTTAATTTVATTTVATTTSVATSSTATTTPGTTTAATTAVTTAVPSALQQPLYVNSSTSRNVDFTPNGRDGTWSVSLICGGVPQPVCGGGFFASVPSAQLIMTLAGSAPDTPDKVAAFTTTFIASVAAAAGIDKSQVVSVVLANTRRRSAGASFTASSNVLGSFTQNDATTVANTVVNAAVSGKVNDQFLANNLPQVSSISFNGQSKDAGAASTTAGTTSPTITPSPNSVATSSVPVATIIAMLFAAVLAFF